MVTQAGARKLVVLVVEDEFLVRMTAVDLVDEAGFEALEAWDADHAVRILEARADIRIVFTDINMPGSMDGLKLAAAIRGRWPPIEISSRNCRGMADDGDQVEVAARFLPQDAKAVLYMAERHPLHQAGKDFRAAYRLYVSNALCCST